MTLREMGAVFARAGKAPAPARTDPPGVPLEGELIARQNTYALDLEGNTPEDFSTRIHFGDHFPETPRVDLVLKLRNTGKETITLRDPRGWLEVHLIGPGALSRPWEPKQTGVGFGPGLGLGDLPISVTLAPGETHTIPITSLSAEGFAYWLLPGEYLIGGKYSGSISPAPPGTQLPDLDSGYVTVRCAPIKVTVVSGNPVPDPGPPAAAHEIRRPPPPGTVIVPVPPDDPATYTRDMLTRPITFEADADTTLKEAVDTLNLRYDLDIRIDETAFQKAGNPEIGQAKIACPPLLRINLHAILQVVLDQVDARMELRDSTIWVLPMVKPLTLAERLYPAPRRFKDWLEDRVDLKGVEGEVPLSKALQILKDEFDLTFVIDARAFGQARTNDLEKRSVRLARHTKVRLDVVLRDVLQQAGANFVIRDRGLLVIIPVRR